MYPDQYEAFLSSITSINLDIGSILSNSCIVKTDFYDRLLLATVGPLVALSALIGTSFVGRRRNPSTQPVQPLLQSDRGSAGLFILFFVYSYVSFTIFETFVCDDLDDGMSYLRADYSLVCSSEKHAAYKVYASIMICVYPVGIPAFFGWWLARNRRGLGSPSREDMVHLDSFRGLWAAYNPSCYYYERVRCSRRIALLPGRRCLLYLMALTRLALFFCWQSHSRLFRSPIPHSKPKSTCDRTFGGTPSFSEECA